jgi:hypothetical protein
MADGLLFVSVWSTTAQASGYRPMKTCLCRVLTMGGERRAIHEGRNVLGTAVLNGQRRVLRLVFSLVGLA